MSFAWPAMLLGLLLVPLLGALVWVAQGRRRRDAARFGTPSLVAGSVPWRPGWRRLAPAGVALAALTLLIVGLARPHATLSVRQREATVMLVLDTSRSMAATDVRPSRFVAAKQAAGAFLETLPSSYSVGIVSFSTAARVVLRPTTDRALARATLGELRLGSGTAIGDAIVRAVVTLRPVTQTGSPPSAPVPSAVLLLSDGAQTQGGITPAVAATRARRQGIPVSTVALGTRDAVVTVPAPGGLEQQVRVAPDARTLRTVARLTGGRFYEAADAARLRSVYEQLGTRLGHRPKRTEITAAFAGGGAALLLLASGLSMLWSRRPL